MNSIAFLIIAAMVWSSACNRRRTVIEDEGVHPTNPNTPMQPTPTPTGSEEEPEPSQPVSPQPRSNIPETPPQLAVPELKIIIRKPSKLKVFFKDCLSIRINSEDWVFVGCNKDFDKFGQPLSFSEGMTSSGANTVYLQVETHKFSTTATGESAKRECIDGLQTDPTYDCQYDQIDKASDTGVDKQIRRFCVERGSARSHYTVFFEDSFLEHDNPDFLPDYQDFNFEIEGQGSVQLSPEHTFRDSGACS